MLLESVPIDTPGLLILLQLRWHDGLLNLTDVLHLKFIVRIRLKMML
jgi:hypothetical protein